MFLFLIVLHFKSSTIVSGPVFPSVEIPSAGCWVHSFLFSIEASVEKTDEITFPVNKRESLCLTGEKQQKPVAAPRLTSVSWKVPHKFFVSSHKILCYFIYSFYLLKPV